MRIKKLIFKRSYISILVAILVFVLTEIASKNKTWVETNYAQKAYPIIANFLSKFSNLFLYSLDDLFYLMLIIIGFFSIVLLLIKKLQLSKFIKLLLNTLAITYTLFYVLWGFNYFREDLNNRLNITEQNTDTEIFISTLKNLIISTNNSYCTFEKDNYSEIDSLIEGAYKLCSPALNIQFPSGKRSDKKITFSGFFAKAGISGYYGPFFNEVHVNKKILPVEYPFVFAHEKAHQFGITSEAEANFYSWLVCTQSDSKQLQYSANLHILRFFLFQAYQLEEYPEIIKKLDKKVVADFQRIQENWAKMRNDKVNQVASKVNDTYLKSNKVKKGIDDYKGVVKFVMDFSQDSVFRKTYNLKVN